MSPSLLQPYTQMVFGDLSGLEYSAQLLAHGNGMLVMQWHRG